MKKEIKVGIPGGDRRMLKTAACLSEAYECAVWGFSKLGSEEYEKYMKNSVRCIDVFSALDGSEAVILPLPTSKDGLNLFHPLSGLADEIKLCDIVSRMDKGTLLLGGMLPSSVVEYASLRGIETADYYECEETQILNAVPTAEGAIKACMEELSVTISGMRATVVGYGRVGRTLATRLRLLGADVFVAARNPRDLAWAKCDGCISVPLDEYKALPIKSDAIFSTAPAIIFDREVLSKTDVDSVIFELTSGNVGVDMESAKNMGIKVLPLPSLPGKNSPDTAGEIICEVVGRILSRHFDEK